MRAVKVFFVTLLLSGCAHKAPPPPTPLFDAFQKYCVATEGRWEAVDKAATADGFRRNGEPVFSPFPIDSTTWQLHKSVIVVGPASMSRAGPDGNMHRVEWYPPGSKAETCGIRIVSDTDNSQAAIAKWTGVPTDKQFQDPKKWGDSLNDKYTFRLEHGRHVAAAQGSPDYIEAVKNGGTWWVLFYRRGSETGVSIRRHFMPSP